MLKDNILDRIRELDEQKSSQRTDKIEFPFSEYFEMEVSNKRGDKNDKERLNNSKEK